VVVDGVDLVVVVIDDGVADDGCLVEREVVDTGHGSADSAGDLLIQSD
jgi:hypothetical protein